MTGAGAGPGSGSERKLTMDRDGAKNGYDIELLRAIRDVVRVPIIASLNGSTNDGWVEYARDLAEAREGELAQFGTAFEEGMDPYEVGAKILAGGHKLF